MKRSIDYILILVSAKVVQAMGLARRVKLEGAALPAVGSRGESETFSFGSFGWRSLEANTGRFDRI